MLRRVSKVDIRKAIDQAEVDFRSCWDVLQQVKSGLEAENFENFLQFQGVLAKAIFELEVIYQRVAQAESKAIHRKHTYSSTWFSMYMNRLKEYKDAIKRTIYIGKSLGDAFAWLFYHEDRRYLQLQHQYGMPSHIPTGMGGIGEVTFIQQTQSIEGYFVLYHGITTTLRVGDFTLIDTKKQRAVAIGELKSHEVEEGTIRVEAVIIGPKFDQEMQRAHRDTTQSDATPLSMLPRHTERLKRQVKKATQLLNARDRDAKQLLGQIETHVEELNTVCRNLICRKVKCQRAGDSLMLTAIKHRKTRLSTKMMLSSMETHDSNLDFGNLTEEVIQIMSPKTEWNSVHISRLQYDRRGESFLLLGMIPLFWWPIDIEIVQKIIFQEIEVLTIFNPAHLRHKLIQNGFEVKIGRDNGHIVELDFYLDDGSMQSIGSCTYFTWMIQHGLITTDSVLMLIQQCKSAINQDDFNPGTLIEFDFYHCTSLQNAIQGTNISEISGVASISGLSN